MGKRRKICTIIFALIPESINTMNLAGFLTWFDFVFLPIFADSGLCSRTLTKPVMNLTAAGTVPDSHRIPFYLASVMENQVTKFADESSQIILLRQE